MKRIIIATCVATLLGLLITTGGSSTGAKENNLNQAVNQPEAFVPGRVLVKFRSGIMADHARQVIAALGARDADELPNMGVHILELPYQASEKAFLNAFQARSEVEFAELDRILEPADITPNDPWYVNWEWHLKKIGAPTAWGATTGSSDIIIAILDTGVDGSHEDLASQMYPGWNVYDNNSDTRDVHGHGTKVSGTAAATSNNGVGVASVAWGCKIMPVRVTDSNGYATFSSIASGLNWAANHGARVANASFAATDSSTVKSAAQYFQGKGGVVTMSAGNTSTFNSSPENQYVLTVSATNQFDALSSFTNTGNNVDLSAPEAAYSTVRGGGYDYVSGTSISAPIVAGVAALVLSINPSLTAQQVQDMLKQNADDLGAPGWDTSYGSGRVNAMRAVSAAGGNVDAPPPASDTTPPTVSINSPSTGATLSGTVTVVVSASDDVAVASVSLKVDGVLVATDTSSPYTFLWNTTTSANGSHTVSATANDAAGNSSNSSISVTVSNAPPAMDTTAPVVSITSPKEGGRASGNLSVLVSTSDNVGVVKTELYVDGVLTATSATAPFTTKWNTQKASRGAHGLQCKTYDGAGNVGFSQIVTVYK